jgi:hypothetical protein
VTTFIFGLFLCVRVLGSLQQPVHSENSEFNTSYMCDFCHQQLMIGDILQMPAPVYCPKNDNTKAMYSCENRIQCFTDYHPHYAANLSLSGMIVGTHKWENNYPEFANWGIPDLEHKELRPGWSATKGPESGEIHFKINVGNHDRITIVGYHYANIILANEFLIELNVPDDRLKDYKPDAAKWHIWTDVVTDAKQGWAMLTNVPPGQHVMSVRSKVNEKKSVAGISHIIMNSDGFY